MNPNQTTYNTTFLRYELSRLEFFPPTSPFVMCYELHFSGSALSTLADCLTKFGSQPPWPRCPALARYIASVIDLKISSTFYPVAIPTLKHGGLRVLDVQYEYCTLSSTLYMYRVL